MESSGVGLAVCWLSPTVHMVEFLTTGVWLYGLLRITLITQNSSCDWQLSCFQHYLVELGTVCCSRDKHTEITPWKPKSTRPMVQTLYWDASTFIFWVLQDDTLHVVLRKVNCMHDYVESQLCRFETTVCRACVTP